MGKSSKKRERTDEDVTDHHDAKPVVKKSKLDINGKAEVTKKRSRVKEAKAEVVAVEEVPKPKKEKKEKKKEEKEKKAKKEKKEKKSKSKEVNGGAPESDESAPAASEPEPEVKERANGVDSTDKKSKKQKKKNKDKKTTATAAAEETQPENITTADDGNENGAAEDAGGSKQTRFICFVGNLPYTATADSVRAHFATLQPASVRLLTQRDDPSKSRGIAFVEFDRYDRMKTCLSKFHHTEFDDGRSAPRRINVELTYVNRCYFSFFSSSSFPLSFLELSQKLTWNEPKVLVEAARRQRAAKRLSRKTPSSTRSGHTGCRRRRRPSTRRRRQRQWMARHRSSGTKNRYTQVVGGGFRMGGTEIKGGREGVE